MNKFSILRGIGLVILLILLLFGGKVLWELHQYEQENNLQLQQYSMFVNKYSIQRNNLWDKHFKAQLASQNYQNLNFDQKGEKLLIDNKYLAFIGHEGQYYSQKTIEKVITQKQSKTKSSINHFIVKSQVNQQVFFLPQNNKQTISFNSKQYLKLQKCLQLENVQLKDKLYYFIDNINNLWLISHPHNNVLFVQIYSCLEGRLLKKFFHEPVYHDRNYMINELLEIKSTEENSYSVKLLTYQSHQYIVEFLYDTENKQYSIKGSSLNPSYAIKSNRISVQKDVSSVKAGQNSPIIYTILDPFNKIFQQQFQYLVFSIVKNFMNQIKFLFKFVGVSPTTLNSYINSKIREYERQKNLQHQNYDILIFDQENQCVLNLQYDLNKNKNGSNSQEKEEGSFITKLNKYLLPSRSPLFHSIDNYDPYDIVEILKQEKTPPVSQFKSILPQNGYERQYLTGNFYSSYITLPDNHVHYIGVGQKIFYLHPAQKVNKQEFLHIRSKTGGLVMQGSKIKGAYQDRPLQKIELTQKYFIQSNQVLAGVHQAHAAYRSLYVSLKGTKLQLVNGLSGKSMVTFNINYKQGYQYAGSYLFNNQWWVVQFNTQTKRSQLTKHELYIEASYPKQINVVKRTYGKLIGSEFTPQEDDLRSLFLEYTNKYGNNGIVVLDIYRCLDEFYYIQFCDSQGKNYAIARIHFKRLSNRQPKSSRSYLNKLEQSLIVQPKNMVKQSQKMHPYLLVLQDVNLFKGIQQLIEQKRLHDMKKYFSKQENKFINQLRRAHKYDLLPYMIYSKQTVPAKQSVQSTQQLTLINLRMLVQNGKKKLMIQTKQLARNRLKYFVIFVVVILSCLMVKLILWNRANKLQTGNKQSNGKESNKQNNGEQKKKESPPKKKNKEKNN